MLGLLPDVVNLIVVALGIKRRLNIAKVNGFITDESSENVKVIAVKKFVQLFASILIDIFLAAIN